MRMNNFKNHDPEVKTFGTGLQYFCDDKGRDFYESRELFTKKYVVFFDCHNMIRAVAKSAEVTRVVPLGLSAVDMNSLPKDFNFPTGIWRYDGKKVVAADFDPAISTKLRKARLDKKFKNILDPLRDVVELGGATEEEKELFENTRKLRVQLHRLSEDIPPQDVDWSTFEIA